MFRDDEPVGTNKHYPHLPAQRVKSESYAGRVSVDRCVSSTRSSCDYTRSPSRSFPSR